MIRQSDNMRLAHFKVRFADGTDSTDALYANGQHQVEVVVEVLKEVVSRTGNWVNAPLTDSERASITIVPIPNTHNVHGAGGWSCDSDKNEYDPGLWNRTGEEPGESLPRNIIIDPRIEVISRYLRHEENTSLEPMQFMATIVLDGENVTNSYSEYPTDFQSSIFVTPTLAPVLLSTDLQQTVDYYALNVPDIDVDVYYWEGTNGLHFDDNYGLLDPLYVPDEGEMFQTAYGASGVFKGGVFKNPRAADWPLRSVHQNLPGVPSNPSPVIRRINKSIMCAARLYTTIPELPHQDSKTKWFLRDNFGTLHAFKIVPQEDGIRLSVEPVKLARRPKDLEITLTNGQDSTNALYANGLHQCKVVIQLKVEQEGMNGHWEESVLRADERASATVTLYSKNVNQALPAGWSCDESRNIYEIGLWDRNLESGEFEKNEDQTTSQQTVASGGMETIDRYMRLDTGASIEERRFMARIVIDGKVYTSNFSEADFQSDYWVHIAPRRPYQVRVADLIRTVDHAYWNASTKTDIDVWYWLPPRGLRFVSQRGLEAPLRINDEGPYFHTAFSHKASPHSRKGGVVLAHDAPGVNPDLAELHRNLPDNNQSLPFNRVNTIMRAVWLSTTNSISEGEAHTPWRLLDNYGCTHSYVLRRNGHNFQLLDFE